MDGRRVSSNVNALPQGEYAESTEASICDVRGCNFILVYNSNQMHKSQSLFYLTTALHGTITHHQEQKTTVTTASGKHYTVIDRVKFTDKEYRQTRLKLQLLNNVYCAENAISSIFSSLFYRTYCISRRLYIIQQL